MAVLVPSLPTSDVQDALPHKTWTREELLLIEETGVFEGTRFELIEGELIDKMGKKFPHVQSCLNTRVALESAFGAGCVMTEAPIDVAAQDNIRNEPEPDVVALRQPLAAIGRTPGPEHVALLVEVSDTTLRLDLTVKARLYARAGIADYWVLDLKRRLLHVLREPVGDGYAQRFEIDEQASISPLAHPDVSIAVTDLLV